MKNYKLLCAFFMIGSLFISNAFGARVHFEYEEISGRSMYGFDTNSDSTDDLVFSTTDPAGFNYVHVILGEPNPGSVFNDYIEVSANNSPSLRVDFVNGTEGDFHLGFAFSPNVEGQHHNYRVFDSSDNLLPSTVDFSQRDVSGVDTYNNIHSRDTVRFTGLASYALIDSSSSFGLRTFSGVFSENDDPIWGLPIPVPSAIWLFGSGLIGLIGVLKQKTKARQSLVQI